MKGLDQNYVSVVVAAALNSDRELTEFLLSPQGFDYMRLFQEMAKAVRDHNSTQLEFLLNHSVIQANLHRAQAELNTLIQATVSIYHRDWECFDLLIKAGAKPGEKMLTEYLIQSSWDRWNRDRDRDEETVKKLLQYIQPTKLTLENLVRDSISMKTLKSVIKAYLAGLPAN